MNKIQLFLTILSLTECSHEYAIWICLITSAAKFDHLTITMLTRFLLYKVTYSLSKYLGEKSLSVQFSCSVMSNSLRPHELQAVLPVHHQLLESTQTQVHWVGDAIQKSHPLLSPSSPAPNLSQHQGLFQWVSSLPQVAKVLEFQTL